MEDVPANRPYVDENDELVFPLDVDEEYRWWAGGKKLKDILLELKVTKTVWNKYVPEEYPEELQQENYPLL